MRTSLLRFLIAFLAVPLLQTSAGQVVGPCDEVLEVGEDLYEQGRSAQVIAIVAECLQSQQVRPATAVRGYRLLALAYLRNDEISQAKLAIVELLGVDPEYEPNPIDDLPAYIALVTNVKSQLVLPPPAPEDPVDEGDELEPATVTETAERSSRFPHKSGALVLRIRGGWSSYGGERGTQGSLVEEFGDNGSVSGSIEIGYSLSGATAVGLVYQLGTYPTMLDPKGTLPEFPSIDPDKSSEFVNYVGLLFRATLPVRSVVRPYGHIGVLGSFGQVNDKVRFGLGPTFALGLDFAVGNRVGLFVEADEYVLLPGDAVDLTDRANAFDLFTSIAAGVRVAVTG